MYTIIIAQMLSSGGEGVSKTEGFNKYFIRKFDTKINNAPQIFAGTHSVNNVTGIPWPWLRPTDFCKQKSRHNHNLPIACSGLRRINVSQTSTNACVCSTVGVSSRLNSKYFSNENRNITHILE